MRRYLSRGRRSPGRHPRPWRFVYALEPQPETTCDFGAAGSWTGTVSQIEVVDASEDSLWVELDVDFAGLATTSASFATSVPLDAEAESFGGTSIFQVDAMAGSWPVTIGGALSVGGQFESDDVFDADVGMVVSVEVDTPLGSIYDDCTPVDVTVTGTRS